MNAPKIQRTGKKMPKKNIHPCLFLSVISPSVNADQLQDRAGFSLFGRR